MDILLTFPYAGLESELEKIVERRARSSDILSMKLYYSFLYAFHVRQGKMRKAAAVMHEQVILIVFCFGWNFSDLRKNLCDCRPFVIAHKESPL